MNIMVHSTRQLKTNTMEELKRHNLRADYGNETGDKIRTEHYVTYNHDYVKWLEDRLLKLLPLGDISKSVCKHCGSTDFIVQDDSWWCLNCHKDHFKAVSQRVDQQRELLLWMSNEPVFTISKDEIDEILDDWKTYSTSC